MNSGSKPAFILRLGFLVALSTAACGGLLGCDDGTRQAAEKSPPSPSREVLTSPSPDQAPPPSAKPEQVARREPSNAPSNAPEAVRPPSRGTGPAPAWPRKMGMDPVTGHVLSPEPKVRHTPRIIAWFPIGNSDTTAANRRIGWNIKKDGWAGFVDKWVEPAIKLGFDAVQLHNPGGTRTGEEMQPDQFLDAKDDGADWVGRGFVEAWRPVTQRVQVIAYLGMLPKNDRFEGYLNRSDRAGFLQCLVDSYRLPLDARMDIAFDAMHTVKPDGWELQVYRLFTAMGVKTYIEPIPNVMDKALFDANFEIMNLTLERALANGEPWVAPLDQLSGERIILLAEPPKGKDWKTLDTWLPGFLQHWTSQGWSVAMSPVHCIETNTRPRDLLRIRDRQPAK